MNTVLQGALRPKFRAYVVGLLLALAFAAPARAVNVLYYADGFEGTNYPAEALSALGDTVTTATSWTDFDTKLAGGSYGLVIALGQDEPLAADITILGNYISAGGHVILADYEQQASYAALMDATYAGTANQNSLTFLPSALTAGITNPQALVNPGWGVYSMTLAPAAGGTSVCSFPSGSCAVSGNHGRTLILGFLTDTPSTDGLKVLENLITFAIAGPGTLTVPVPTLSAWVLAALLLGMGMLGVALVRGRGQA